jgi:hypothetical protein
VSAATAAALARRARASRQGRFVDVVESDEAILID